MKRLRRVRASVVLFLAFSTVCHVAYGGAEAAAVYTQSSPAETNVPGETCGIASRPLVPTSPPIRLEEVEELKERLFELGLYYGNIDDVYDGVAQQSVLQFKLSHGLPANAVVDDAVWTALAEDDAPETAPERREGGQTGPSSGDRAIVIDTRQLRLTLLVDGEPFKSYPVAVGRDAEQRVTPVGEWRIVHKDSWGEGFGTRWMGLNVPWGTYGIHGTNKPWSVGTRASSGCIRMLNRDVEELFEWVGEGTRVKIVGVNKTIVFARDLMEGNTGRDVVQVQLSLRDAGFAVQEADGRYGPGTAEAVRRLQEAYGLPVDGVAYTDVLTVLGLARR